MTFYLKFASSAIYAIISPMQKVSFWPLFAKLTLYTFLFLLLFFFLTLVGLGFFAKHELDVFAKNANVTPAQFFQTLKTGWNTKPNQVDGHANFLILGTDGLANRGHNTVLTDTMLLVSLNLKSGKVAMYSLPRDLWNDDYKTKINAFYQYGVDRYPSEPQRFPREVVEQLTQTKIHHTIIITMDSLAALIDEAGGVDVNIKEGFIDPMFPREDVDVKKVHDPKLLYKTVEFKTGVEHMSGARILEYVRSRHSTSDQGNDIARGQRQQEVILDLVNELKNPSFYKNVPRAGKLYQFYVNNFAQYLPVTEAIGIARALVPFRNSITFQTNSPTIFPDDPNGVITHPKPSKAQQMQWIYVIRDLAKFQAEVKQKLQ